MPNFLEIPLTSFSSCCVENFHIVVILVSAIYLPILNGFQHGKKLKNNKTYYYDDCRCRIVFLKGRLKVDIVIWHLFLRPID
jgi:hypothetical protein